MIITCGINYLPANNPPHIATDGQGSFIQGIK